MPVPSRNTKEQWVLWLDALNRHRSREAALDEVRPQGITATKLTTWRHRYGEQFLDLEKLAEAGTYTDAQNEGVDFPKHDFLEYRTLSCAYQIQEDEFRGTPSYVTKAVNTWFQKDAYEKLQQHRRLIVVMPPNHVKTTFFGQEYPTWLLMGNRNKRILIVQKNERSAKKLVASVQQRLTDSAYYDYMIARLKEQGEEPILNPLTTWFDHAPFKSDARRSGETWGAQSFMVKGRTSGEKDLSMEAVGVGGQIQGQRADLIILDDIQDPQVGMNNPEDGKKLVEWFDAVILGRVTPNQQVVVLANYFAPDDFAHQLIAAHPTYAVVEYPAILTNDDGERVPLSPETWTMEGLAEKEQEVGPMRWHYTWMQDETSYELSTFKREALEQARDEERRLGVVPKEVTHIYMGCDPATQGWCPIIVWGLDKRTKQRYLIDLFHEKGMRNWGNVIDKLLEMAARYHPKIVVVEGNNTQKGFINEDSLHRGVRSLGSRLVIYQTVTGSGARAEQTNFDVTTIGGLFDGGLVTLPYAGTWQERKVVDDYIDELVKWRTDDFGHSIKQLVRDQVMATLFAESEAFDEANRPERKPASTRKGLPSGRQPMPVGFSWKDAYRDVRVRRFPRDGVSVP